MSVQHMDLVVFDAEGASEITEGLGLTTARRYLEEDGQRISCGGCDSHIRIDKFGAALPGSRKYYCDNPACLQEYVVYKFDGKL